MDGGKVANCAMVSLVRVFLFGSYGPEGTLSLVISIDTMNTVIRVQNPQQFLTFYISHYVLFFYCESNVRLK